MLWIWPAKRELPVSTEPKADRESLSEGGSLWLCGRRAVLPGQTQSGKAVFFFVSLMIRKRLNKLHSFEKEMILDAVPPAYGTRKRETKQGRIFFCTTESVDTFCNRPFPNIVDPLRTNSNPM